VFGGLHERAIKPDQRIPDRYAVDRHGPEGRRYGNRFAVAGPGSPVPEHAIRGGVIRDDRRVRHESRVRDRFHLVRINRYGE